MESHVINDKTAVDIIGELPPAEPILPESPTVHEDVDFAEILNAITSMNSEVSRLRRTLEPIISAAERGD